MTVSEISDKILDENFGIDIYHAGGDESFSLGEDTLTHYGVKGMKWGVRKEYVPHPRKPGKKSKRQNKQKKRPKWESEELSFVEVKAGSNHANASRENKIDRKLLRNVAITVGVTAVAGLSIYAAKKYIDYGKEISLDILRRLGTKDIDDIVLRDGLETFVTIR